MNYSTIKEKVGIFMISWSWFFFIRYSTKYPLFWFGVVKATYGVKHFWYSKMEMCNGTINYYKITKELEKNIYKIALFVYPCMSSSATQHLYAIFSKMCVSYLRVVKRWSEKEKGDSIPVTRIWFHVMLSFAYRIFSHLNQYIPQCF